MSHTILDVRNSSIRFGGLRAIDEVSIHVDTGEIVALIGPNGAGKTTLFNCITGLYKPTGGDIAFFDSAKKFVRINGFKPNKITELGLARTFQNIRLFSSMTALENVMIGYHSRLKAGVLGAILRDRRTRAEEQDVIDVSMGILRKLRLERYANEIASNLPYGAQRLLEIARAMATGPQLLLLDEPAAGMNLVETKRLDYFISKIRDEEQITILLIEHDMNLVMSIAERIYVLDYGSLIAEGSPAEIRMNPAVIKAYLGE